MPSYIVPPLPPLVEFGGERVAVRVRHNENCKDFIKSKEQLIALGMSEDEARDAVWNRYYYQVYSMPAFQVADRGFETRVEAKQYIAEHNLGPISDLTGDLRFSNYYWHNDCRRSVKNDHFVYVEEKRDAAILAAETRATNAADVAANAVVEARDARSAVGKLASENDQRFNKVDSDLAAVERKAKAVDELQPRVANVENRADTTAEKLGRIDADVDQAFNHLHEHYQALENISERERRKKVWEHMYPRRPTESDGDYISRLHRLSSGLYDQAVQQMEGQ